MKKWKLRSKITKTAEKKLIDYPPFLRDLLFAKGILDEEAAAKYLHPSYESDLYDPALMLGMDQAVKRILKAIEWDEKIIIYGDYDADGVPGTVVLHSFFKAIGYSQVDIYLPNRHLESHGLNSEALEKIATDGAKLIITVDCGITNTAEVKKAKKLGIDVIVTDHHLVPKEAPEAFAILDSKQNKDSYPFNMLCGCAVAFKLVIALMRQVDYEFPVGWDKWLLDLVAIATISDMVPMVDENRILTHFGLKVLRQTRRVGLLELFKVMKLKKENVTEDDIGFMIGPRLNAASRMSHASQSFFLLTTNDRAEAATIAKHLEEKNKERKILVEHIFEIVDKQLALLDKIPDVIVAGNEEWPNGGLGLACNKIKDKHNRSVFLWGGNGDPDLRRGSSRSDGTVNLVELMRLAGGKELFADYGGHILAAGFSLTKDKVPELESRLLRAYEKIAKTPIEEEILIDRDITPDEITWTNYDYIEQMGPYGIGNTKPLFLLRGVEVLQVKTFGNDGIHLELAFTNSGGKKIVAIGFFTCSPAKKFDAINGHIFNGAILAPGQKIDLLVNLEKSTFKNYPELRLRIVDLKQAE
ncbi:MAG: single-stranded-DNA-specific exonuclease RecJ [Patescibacteria group bacterium]